MFATVWFCADVVERCSPTSYRFLFHCQWLFSRCAIRLDRDICFFCFPLFFQCNPASRGLIMTQVPSGDLVTGVPSGPEAWGQDFWRYTVNGCPVEFDDWSAWQVDLHPSIEVVSKTVLETGNPGSAGDLVTQVSFWGDLWHPCSLWGHMLPYDCMVLLTRASTGGRNWVRPSPRFLLGVYFNRFSFRWDLWSPRFPLGLST